MSKVTEKFRAILGAIGKGREARRRQQGSGQKHAPHCTAPTSAAVEQ